MQWFEKEHFWLNYGPIMFDAQRWAEAPNVAESIIKIAGLKKGDILISIDDNSLENKSSEYIKTLIQNKDKAVALFNIDRGGDRPRKDIYA